ncbi:expressed unknown protein [Seminavis robusta]|uniref:Uncharacterized protein n=1 Tax=Seminavis robusta TaxID=568900 RepID=A0A9N8EI46_9STRA|nr:expressed unknown protein [Seminavis robusta]|eukprot:Sro990_g228630.1 n/a (411) ;mRNA; f:34260-35561
MTMMVKHANHNATTRQGSNKPRRIRKLPSSRKSNHSLGNKQASSKSFRTTASGTSAMFHTKDGDDMSQYAFSVDPSMYNNNSSGRQLVSDNDNAQPPPPQEEDWEELKSVDESVYWDRSIAPGQPVTQKELEEVWKRTRGMLVKDTSIPKLIVPKSSSTPKVSPPKKTSHRFVKDNNDKSVPKIIAPTPTKRSLPEDASEEMDLMGSSRTVFKQMQLQQQKQLSQQQRPPSQRVKQQPQELDPTVTEEESMAASAEGGSVAIIRPKKGKRKSVLHTGTSPSSSKKKGKRKSVLHRFFGSIFSTGTSTAKKSKGESRRNKRQSLPTKPNEPWDKNYATAGSAPNRAYRSVGTFSASTNTTASSNVRKSSAKQRRRHQSTGVLVLEQKQKQPMTIRAEAPKAQPPGVKSVEC